MKICSRCQKTYTDDNLNFCLEDGSVLSSMPSQTDQLAETMFVPPPRPTQAQPQMQSMPTQPAWNPQPQPQYSVQPRPQKSSKTWVWILLILGGVVLLCGGGGLGFLFYLGSRVENTANSNNSGNGVAPANRGTSNSTSNSTSASTRTDLETIDLSGWVKENSDFGNTEMSGGEFLMSSKKKGFYYALVSPDVYTTQNADTRVTVRNVNNASGSLGYGLIFHSNPQPLQQDYAFLIDTQRKKYRVVSHSPRNEKSVITWTTSPAIKEGSAENVLEARDMADKIELYINGTMVTSIKNDSGYAGGVPGLYAGDGVKVAFKNLEIRK